MEFPVADLLSAEQSEQWILEHFHPHGLRGSWCQFPGENPGKRLLVIVESNGCFSDGEEIVNERELTCSGRTLCRACAGEGYYQPVACAAPVEVN